MQSSFFTAMPNLIYNRTQEKTRHDLISHDPTPYP